MRVSYLVRASALLALAVGEASDASPSPEGTCSGLCDAKYSMRDAMMQMNELRHNVPSQPSPNPQPSPSPAHVFPHTCAEILSNNPTATSGIYTIDPDGDYQGGVASFEVYCDMTTQGGGWALVQLRRNDGANFDATGTPEPTSSWGSTMQTPKFMALKKLADEVLVHMSGTQELCSGCTTCIIANASRLNSANCQSFSTVTSAYAVPWGHDEITDCTGGGADYSYFLGFSPTRQNYVTGRSANPFYRDCTSNAYAVNTYAQFQYASVYLRAPPPVPPT